MAYHVAPEDLAQFVDGAIDEFKRARIWAHLHSCEPCFEAYQYAVRFAGVRPDEHMILDLTAVDAAKRIAGSPVAETAGTRRSRRRVQGAFGWAPRFRPALGLAAAAATIVVGAVVWFGGGGPGGETAIDAALRAPVERVMIASSQQRAVVFPEVADRIRNDAPGLRSGAIATDAELDAAVSNLADRYRREHDAESAEWLIGAYLATGQLNQARTFITDARGHHPNDGDLIAMAAMLAYAESDLGEAASLLRMALSEDGDNHAARLNLGIVLAEQGNRGDAEIEFRRVAKDARGALAERAAQQLAELSR